jgi:signal transduction histidine kinase
MLSQDVLHTLLDHLPCVVWVDNEHGKCVYQNLVCQEEWGDLIGHKSEQLEVPPALLQEWKEEDTRVRSGEIVRKEVEYERLFGRTGNFLKILVPLPERQKLGIYLDITEQRHAQAAQAVMQIALQQAHQQSEAQRRTINMVMHELRAPLSSILLSTELLDRHYPQIPKEKFLSYMNQIRQQIQKMRELIDDLLTFDRPFAGTVQELELVTFCQALLPSLEGGQRVVIQSQDHQILLHIADVPLRQILENLLTNALKYSVAEKKVYLRLARCGLQVMIQVQDFGIGIPAEDLEQLFTMFHRARNVGKVPGTGLGLAIVKHLMDQIHGEIQVNSVVGEGSVFTLLLPVGTLGVERIHPSITVS